MQTRRILIVDDSEPFLKYIAMILRRTPETEIVGAVASLGEAIACAAAAVVDVVLLDASVLSGEKRGVIQQLRATRREMKIVLMSGFDLPECREYAGDLGADLFISKLDLNTDLLPLMERLCPR